MTYDHERFVAAVRRECVLLAGIASERAGLVGVDILEMARRLPPFGFAAELILRRIRENPTARTVASECSDLAAMLIAKNAAYGNSALDPIRVFSQADPAEQIRVRLDDKLSRLARGQAAGEDVVRDLLGYLVLLRIAERGSP